MTRRQLAGVYAFCAGWYLAAAIAEAVGAAREASRAAADASLVAARDASRVDGRRIAVKGGTWGRCEGSDTEWLIVPELFPEAADLLRAAGWAESNGRVWLRPRPHDGAPVDG